MEVKLLICNDSIMEKSGNVVGIRLGAMAEVDNRLARRSKTIRKIKEKAWCVAALRGRR